VVAVRWEQECANSVGRSWCGCAADRDRPLGGLKSCRETDLRNIGMPH